MISKFLWALLVVQAHAGIWTKLCDRMLINPAEYDHTSVEVMSALAMKYQMKTRWQHTLTPFEQSDFGLLRSTLRLRLLYGSAEEQTKVQMALDDGLEF